MAGGSTAKPFFVGEIVRQPPEALDAFVAVAQAGNEFVYCEAPSPIRDETWLRAGALARLGLVRTHDRRRPGGGRQWYLVRTRKPLPKDVSPQEKVLMSGLIVDNFAGGGGASTGSSRRSAARSTSPSTTTSRRSGCTRPTTPARGTSATTSGRSTPRGHRGQAGRARLVQPRLQAFQQGQGRQAAREVDPRPRLGGGAVGASGSSRR
jgi:hypothetical protein